MKSATIESNQLSFLSVMARSKDPKPVEANKKPYTDLS